ncbi:MAG TPA: hypothetical protein VK116_15650, partial [Planctomycetota bacterium]|nr:hypothetical protein [Planctomycetota bacterium]
YDARGGRASVLRPDGRRVSTPRDASGRVVELADEGLIHGVYARSSAGLLVSAQAGNGLSLSFMRSAASGAPTLGAYDALGRALEARITRAGETVLGYEYGRNASGAPLFERRLHERNAPGDVWRYDSIYRVVRYLPDVVDPRVPPIDPVRKIDFTLDASHNWRVLEIDQGVRSVSVDALGRITSIAGDPVAWDDAGNLVSYGARRVYHDALGRPVRIVDGGEDVARFTWDADGAIDIDGARRGRRVTRTLLRSSPGEPAGTRRAIWDGLAMIEERDGDGRLLREWLYPEEGDPPAVLVRHDAMGSALVYLVSDARGNVTGAFAPDASLLEEVRYGPFGKPIVLNSFGNPVSVPVSGNTLLFGSSPFDFTTGLISNGDRLFVPDLGRHASERSPFVIADPLERNGWLSPGLSGMPGRFPGQGLPDERDPIVDRVLESLKGLGETSAEPALPSTFQTSPARELLPRAMLSLLELRIDARMLDDAPTSTTGGRP